MTGACNMTALPSRWRNWSKRAPTLPAAMLTSIIAYMMLDPLTPTEIEKEEEIKQESAEEPPFKVLIHNDDVTPYDFVIAILIRIFSLTPIIAEHITYLAHTNGVALVVVLPKTEAEQRVGKAHFAARLEGFPLTFSLEPDD